MKLSQRFFYWKLDVCWKNVLQWIPKTIESTTFFLKIFYLVFVLLLHCSISVECYYDENPVNQAAFLYLKLPLKSSFFGMSWLFLERQVLAYFNIILFFQISRQKFQMEGDERNICGNAPDWKPLFLLKISIKRNLGFPFGEYNTFFRHIHQNIRAYPRSKENLHWTVIWKTLHIEQYEQRKGLTSKFSLFQIHLGDLVGVAIPGNVCNFCPRLNLEKVFMELKLTQNCYANVNKCEHFFFLKIGNLITN